MYEHVLISTAPPDPPLNFEVITEGPRALTFSWDPPAGDKRITGYLLSCDPLSTNLPRAFNKPNFNQMGGVDPVTVYGFTPFTTYNCSAVTLGYTTGDGHAASAIATTEEDCKQFIQ